MLLGKESANILYRLPIFTHWRPTCKTQSTILNLETNTQEHLDSRLPSKLYFGWDHYLLDRPRHHQRFGIEYLDKHLGTYTKLERGKIWGLITTFYWGLFYIAWLLYIARLSYDSKLKTNYDSNMLTIVLLSLLHGVSDYFFFPTFGLTHVHTSCLCC
jgi:hypothetical protein